MFHFVNQDGTELSSNPHFYEGKGCTSFSIRPTGNAYGNALIGVRKKRQDTQYPDYSWTWHLWFTDYNPDGPMSIGNGNSEFIVPGGTILRFNNPYFIQDRQAYMMDRNLGAYCSNYNEGLEDSKDVRCYGLYYQFSRKEPIPVREPGKVRRYKLNEAGVEYVDTVKFTHLIKNGYTSIDEAIHNPTVFYQSINDKKRWCQQDDKQDETWDLISWDTTKRLLDPAPEGWTIPSEYKPYLYVNSLSMGNRYNLLQTFKFKDSNHIITFPMGYSSFRLKVGNFSEVNGGPDYVWFALKGRKPDADKTKKVAYIRAGNETQETEWLAGDHIGIRLVSDPNR